MRISVCITTFRNAEGFARAARSVFAQRGLHDMDVELIAVDNAPEGSAQRTFAAIESAAPIPFRYAHERRAGASHARNAALRLASGDLIAWLDDTQEASPLWLDRLVAARHKLGADIVFGPIEPEAPKGPHRDYFEKLYARTGPRDDTVIVAPLGVVNSLAVRSRILGDFSPFAPGTDDKGGHYANLVAGARLGWAAEAGVVEHIAPARATPRAAMRRAFSAGRVATAEAAANASAVKVGMMMLGGAGRMLFHGAAALIASALRPSDRIESLDRMAEGAGRLTWFAASKRDDYASA